MKKTVDLRKAILPLKMLVVYLLAFLFFLTSTISSGKYINYAFMKETFGKCLQNTRLTNLTTSKLIEGMNTDKTRKRVKKSLKIYFRLAQNN